MNFDNRQQPLLVTMSTRSSGDLPQERDGGETDRMITRKLKSPVRIPIYSHAMYWNFIVFQSSDDLRQGISRYGNHAWNR